VSKSTILASGQIIPSPHHTITVELVDPDGMPATVRIGWPPQPTVINLRRFPELAARVARIFADFTESARVVRARAAKYAERMYVSDRFLNRAAALEGFDRIRTRKGRGRYYADRVRQCIDIAGPQFGSLVHDPAKWTTELKDHRDEIAHHYGRRMWEKTEEQHYISDAAYWLLMFCLLRQASVADATFDKLLAHRKLRSLANKLRAILC
jgi:hypothetical protein